MIINFTQIFEIVFLGVPASFWWAYQIHLFLTRKKRKALQDQLNAAILRLRATSEVCQRVGE